MYFVSIEEAQARLAEIIARLTPGEEIMLTRDDRPVAKLVALPPPSNKPRQPGTLKGTVLYMAPDFDDIPEGFEEYTE